jgi:hypothetical protein
MNFELDGLNYQFEIFIDLYYISRINLVSKNACCAVYYTAPVVTSYLKHIDNAIENGRIKLQYIEDCKYIKCEYEYETEEGLKNGVVRFDNVRAGPKDLIEQQKAHIAEINAIRCEIEALKAKLL